MKLEQQEAPVMLGIASTHFTDAEALALTEALASLPCKSGEGAEMTAEEHRLEDLKQMAAYAGPVVSFEFREPYYLASCDHCGWVGSSERCGTDTGFDDSDVYCPRCQSSGADCGKVATQHPAFNLPALSTPSEQFAKSSPDAELFQKAASLVYRIEAAGAVVDEGSNFERWKADARTLAPELRATLATSSPDAAGSEGEAREAHRLARLIFPEAANAWDREVKASLEKGMSRPGAIDEAYRHTKNFRSEVNWTECRDRVRKALAALTPDATQTREAEAWQDAWNEFFNEHLTDGNDGYRSADVISQCRAAFDAAWVGGEKPANDAARAALNGRGGA